MLILLADDEKMVRLGLQSMLEELFPQEHTYLHARNGQEVIYITQKQHPDIAFLDVKMPLLNGLEALSQCKALSPFTIWIILSGYADFEYARQALSLSAFEYILKPIDIHTLRQLFNRILLSQQETFLQSNKSFANDIIRSFNMSDQFGVDDTDFLPAARGNYILYQIYINRTKKETQHIMKQQLCGAISGFCKPSNTILNHCLFFNTAGNLCFICSVENSSRVTHFMASLCHNFEEGAISIFYGNSDTIKGIYLLSLRIQDIAGIRVLYSNGKPLFLSNIETLPDLPKILSFYDAFETLLDSYLSYDIGTYKQLLTEYYRNKDMAEIFPVIDQKLFYQYLTDILNHTFTAKSYTSLIQELISSLNITSTNTALKTTGDIIKIKDFVYKNYAKDVGISYVSECFNLSPTYLSRLFHEKTGEKYIDFVTKVRMEHAKEMFQNNPELSVKQAAEAVGYSSVRHFSKTFQKYTGMLPSSFNNK